MDDTLLFLHVLSAFMLVSAVVMLTASVLGAAIPPVTETVANRIWDLSGAGTLGFGLWIVFREDVYDVTDGWILGALALWATAGVLATLIRRSLASAAPDGGRAAAWPATAVRLHWVHAMVTVGFLVLMIWKPGA
ncbi:MAG: hypothetical protein M3340_16650 [Actinomycetota bacterium]|nr:hypothetical protein [Actinomycetota bacterium]